MEILMGAGSGGAGRGRPCGGAGHGWRRAAVLCAAAALSGCVEVERELAPPPVNPSSSIASYAEKVAEAPFAMPSLKDLPPKVTNPPTAEAYKGAVVGEIAQRRNLEIWWVSHPPMTDNTEGFAEQARGRIPTGQAAPVPQTHDAESEAFAKRLREAATRPQ